MPASPEQNRQPAPPQPTRNRAADTIASFWEQLNMEDVARRLIATARMATGEQMIGRVHRAARLRDRRLGRVIDGEKAGPATRVG